MYFDIKPFEKNRRAIEFRSVSLYYHKLLFSVLNRNLSSKDVQDSENANQVSLILSNQAELKFPSSLRDHETKIDLHQNNQEKPNPNEILGGRKLVTKETKPFQQSPERPSSQNSNTSANSRLRFPSGDYSNVESATNGASNEPRDEVQSTSFSEPRKKKTRTVFSRSQIFQLESTFDMKRYLSSSERANLAASLHLTETQVGY